MTDTITALATFRQQAAGLQTRTDVLSRDIQGLLTRITEFATRHEDGGVWLSKRELAAARRIAVASADKLIRRQEWRKRPGACRVIPAPILVCDPWTQPRTRAAAQMTVAG